MASENNNISLTFRRLSRPGHIIPGASWRIPTLAPGWPRLQLLHGCRCDGPLSMVSDHGVICREWSKEKKRYQRCRRIWTWWFLLKERRRRKYVLVKRGEEVEKRRGKISEEEKVYEGKRKKENIMVNEKAIFNTSLKNYSVKDNAISHGMTHSWLCARWKGSNDCLYIAHVATQHSYVHIGCSMSALSHIISGLLNIR